jgi:putative nucleotidyltransferase with HDIG domain
MNRETAFNLVRHYVKNEGLINHMRSVEAAMRFYADQMDQDRDAWGLAGLLHDFDWEIHPTPEQHPLEGEAILRAHQVPEDIIQSILSHADHTGISRTTLMQKALYACDEVTGLITAVALVRPSHSLYDLTATSVKKKWKDRAFAAGANREEIEKGANEFGVELWLHVDNVILAMRKIAPQIGLAGAIEPSD